MPILPNYHKSLAKATLLRKRRYFPSIYRFIPERDISYARIVPKLPLITICIISLYLLYSSFFQLITLLENRQKLENIIMKRQEIAAQISYWQDVAAKYPGYPDVYVKIAQLEYSRGEVDGAQSFLQKALSLNPHSQAGIVLGEQIKRGGE